MFPTKTTHYRHCNGASGKTSGSAEVRSGREARVMPGMTAVRETAKNDHNDQNMPLDTRGTTTCSNAFS